MMVKKRGPTEVIESTPHPKIEHSFIKYPGEEPADVTDYRKSKTYRAKKDWTKSSKLIDSNKGRRYTDIHTHPTSIDYVFGASKKRLSRIKDSNALPSGTDLRVFLKRDDLKTAVIAVRDSQTGEVLGYHFFRKTRNTPSFGTSEEDFEKHPFKTVMRGLNLTYFGLGKKSGELWKDVSKYGKVAIMSIKKGEYSETARALDSLAEKYHFQHRLVPAKGYQSNEFGSAFVKKGLEGATLATSIIGFLGAMLFWTFNLTGNVIGIGEASSAWIGAILFIIGLTATSIYINRIKK